jgi:hypothetical protein
MTRYNPNRYWSEVADQAGIQNKDSDRFRDVQAFKDYAKTVGRGITKDETSDLYEHWRTSGKPTTYNKEDKIISPYGMQGPMGGRSANTTGFNTREADALSKQNMNDTTTSPTTPTDGDNVTTTSTTTPGGYQSDEYSGIIPAAHPLRNPMTNQLGTAIMDQMAGQPSNALLTAKRQGADALTRKMGDVRAATAAQSFGSGQYGQGAAINALMQTEQAGAQAIGQFSGEIASLASQEQQNAQDRALQFLAIEEAARSGMAGNLLEERQTQQQNWLNTYKLMAEADPYAAAEFKDKMLEETYAFEATEEAGLRDDQYKIDQTMVESENKILSDIEDNPELLELAFGVDQDGVTYNRATGNPVSSTNEAIIRSKLYGGATVPGASGNASTGFEITDPALTIDWISNSYNSNDRLTQSTYAAFKNSLVGRDGSSIQIARLDELSRTELVSAPVGMDVNTRVPGWQFASGEYLAENGILLPDGRINPQQSIVSIGGKAYKIEDYRDNSVVVRDLETPGAVNTTINLYTEGT